MSENENLKQIDLFSDKAMACKNAALQALEALDFSSFRKNITLARKIDSSLAGVHSISTIGKLFQTKFEISKDSRTFLVNAWYAIPAAVQEGKLTEKEGHFADQILAKIVKRKVKRTYTSFIDREEKLHWSCCLIVLGENERARQMLLAILSSTHNHRSDLWGYYGDVNILLGNHLEANAAYLRALVLDPQKLDIFRLKHKRLVQIYTQLLRIHPEKEARALLSTHGWLEGLFSILKGNTWLMQQSRILQDQLSQELPLYKHERWQRFSVCLYLDQSRAAGEIDYKAREQMLALDAELFKRYLAKLE